MEMGSRSFTSSAAATAPTVEEDMDLRRGPWTVDEDLALMNYITAHGEGRWNSLARSAGLRRTGKSCRLRWLNYLRPDVRRGNITPEEQLLILELHSRWGNRWSKIAQQLPGRTDNEIKNYWRTRVQKHAKQLKCDVNSKQFKDVMRYIWMPRLIERIRAANPGSSAQDHLYQNVSPPVAAAAATTTTTDTGSDLFGQVKLSPGNSSTAGSSADSLSQQFSSPPVSDCFGDWYNVVLGGDDQSGDGILTAQFDESWSESLPGLPDFDFGNWGENLWSVEDIWSQQQF